MFASIPLTALRTFESAARLVSFKAAAEELNVTPTAVSHQIRGLEAWLGCLLFERLGRGVRLTEKGAQLQHSLHGALLDISRSVEELRPVVRNDSLSLSTTPAFAALWLIPRLGDFYRQHPGVRVRIETSNAVADLQRDSSLDLAVRCGFANYPQLLEIPLLEERFVAYGTAQLIARLPEQPVELISVTWPNPQPVLPDWQDWSVATAQDWVTRCTLRDYPDEHYALQAAVSGQGLVLASSLLASDCVANGLLVPYRPDVELPGARYFVVCVPGRERQPAVQSFLRWLQAEMPEKTKL
ncbi:LysR substrate-binding domain-containing protein [Aquipseudomonas campi]